ncbi:MAG TPA: amidohydrolase family protein, partial [Gemmatales bacterium]|nr:amidohydrolase family protein [Gemmatales bacterium]
MKLLVRGLALASLLFAIVLTQLPAQPPGKLKPTVFAITQATVVPKAGTELSKTTIVIRDGVVQAMGPDVQPPADAKVIDGKSLVIYPGFIDAGNIWGVDISLRRSTSGPAEPVDLASESLAITKPDNRKGLTPEFDVATALKAEDESANNWREQGIVARLVYPEGNILGGQSALLLLNGAAPRNAIVRANVALHGALKSMGFGGGYPSTLMGTVAHFRQFLYDAGYQSRLQKAFQQGTLTARPVFDPALNTAAQVLEGKLPLILEADGRDEMNRALDICAEFGVKPILFGCAEGWRLADRLKKENITCIVRLGFPDKARMQLRRRGGPGVFDTQSSEDTQSKDLPAKVVQDFERRHQEEVKNLSVLMNAGIRCVIATQGVESTDKFLAKVRKVISEGVPAEKALAALTQGPAELFGVDKLFGEIAVGKPAYLVAFSAKFTDDKAKVKHVFAETSYFEYGTETKPAATGDPKERISELKEKIARSKERMERGKAMLEQVPENRRAQFKTRMDEAEKGLKADEEELNKLLKRENPAPKEEKPEEKKAEDKKPAEAGKKPESEEKKPASEEKKTDAKKPDEKKAEEKDKKADLPAEVDADRLIKNKTGGNVHIKNATVLTATKGKFVGDIVVQGGKIT